MKTTTWTTTTDDGKFKASLIGLLRCATGRVYRGKLLVGWEMGRVNPEGRRVVVIKWDGVHKVDIRPVHFRGIRIPARYESVSWATASCLWLLSWSCNVRTEGV